MNSLQLIPGTNTRSHFSVVLLLFLLLLSSDQLLKIIATAYLSNSPEVSLFWGFIRLNLIKNHGGFLGFFNNLSQGTGNIIWNSCIALMLLACIVMLLSIPKSRKEIWIPMVFIIGGGLSNLLDKLLHKGGVIDFLIIGTDYLHTGVFNLADVYILLGSFFLGFFYFLPEQKRSSPR